MSNVSAIREKGNPTPEEAAAWLEAKAERGDIPATTGRYYSSAIRSLAGILDGDDGSTAEWLLVNLDAVGDRWARLNADKVKSDTARTYISRAKAGLENYLEWRKDPTNFRFKKRERKEGGPKVSKKATQTKGSASPGQAEQASPPKPQGNARSFPLGEGRSFDFALPEAGISAKEVMRIACHLLTFAHDFDPTDQKQGQIFAIAKRQES